MTLAEFHEIVRNLWSVWLMVLFLGIVAWAYWPTRKRRSEMHDHAQIPFRDGIESK